MPSAGWLRQHAVRWAFPGTSRGLAAAVADLQFVQADPIRAPARAQDLILRQRVRGYRAGDLERHYPSLALDEDWLYAYGFVARDLMAALHPRRDRHAVDGRFVLSPIAADVLAFVTQNGVTHPRAVQAHLGHDPVVNAWGGRSSATTLELERLRHFGYLRVADRVAGVRRYELAATPSEPLPAADRLRRLALRLARTLAPIPHATLTGLVQHLVPGVSDPQEHLTGRRITADLRADGELASATVEGTTYLWPADLPTDVGEAPARVRILAPFDPLVWDRRRFAQLWGWEYRFEAYTPPAKRRLGYYAMPLLWRDRVVGWATCAGPTDDVQVGYVDQAPSGTTYIAALHAEIERLTAFLAGPSGSPVRGALRSADRGH